MSRAANQEPRTTKLTRGSWSMFRGVILMLLLGSWLVARGSHSAQGAERIASLNACTDELLLQLSEPGQVVAVTHFEHSPVANDILSRYPSILRLSDDAEDVLKVRPSVVLAGPFSNKQLLEQLKQFGVVIEMVSVPRDWNELMRSAAKIAKVTKYPEKYVSLQKQIKELQAIAQNSRWKNKRAVFWSAAGHVSGKGTFENTLIQTFGMKNVVERDDYAFIGLEELIQLHPDVIVVTQDPSQKNSWAYETLFHPGIKTALPDLEYLVLPETAVSCASPYTIESLKKVIRDQDQ